MADKNIGDLPLAERIIDTDKFLLEQSGNAKCLPGTVLRQYAAQAGEDAAGSLQRGYRGYGITNVRLTSGNHAAGTLDTYTVDYEDGHTSTFQIYNGANGSGAVNSVNGATGAVVTRSFTQNKTVATSAWSRQNTYTDYPYRASIAISGTTTSHAPEVVFSPDDAESGNFAPVAQTYSGGVYIYAASVPSATITIPTIIVWR